MITSGVHALIAAAPQIGPVVPSEDSAAHGFLVGPENQDLESAVLSFLDWAVGTRGEQVEWSAEGLSPLTVAGGPGMGKSQLAQDVVHWWNESYPRSKGRCDTAVDFARAFREAEQLDDLEGFRERYDTVALLVVEDLHRLVELEPVQCELARLLQVRGDNILPTMFTMVAPLASANDWLGQLTGRLSSGLVAEIVPPGPQTRLDWIRRWMRVHDRAIDDSAAEHLATHVDFNIPQLAGALTQLHRAARQRQHVPGALFSAGPTGPHFPPVRHSGSENCSTVTETSITLADVQAHIHRWGICQRVGIADIVKATAKQTRLKVADIRGKSRRTGIMRARSVAMYLCRDLTNLSFEKIGEYFSDRDHTTVIHACRKIEGLLSVEAELKVELDEIRSTVRILAARPTS